MKIVTLFFCMCLVSLSFAQSPQGINYQAVLRNSTGSLVLNTTVGYKLEIRKTSITGPIVYAERHTPLSNAQGLINVIIGAGTVIQGSFSTVNWGSGPYFLVTSVDFSGGTNYQTFGSQQLMSVPYALYANTAGAAINKWHYGTTIPTSSLGVSGDYYLQTDSGNVFYNNGGTWGIIGNLKGPTGPTGATGAIGLTGPAGASGPQGPAGVNGTNGVDGKNSLVKTTTEIAGANCSTGGVKLEYGLDINGNGILDVTEINAGLTKYVCNGLVGATGATGPAGSTGPQGPAGPQGSTGPQGPAGTDAQTLSINGSQLTISNGNTVTLPSGGGGSGGTLDQAYDFGGAGAGRVITSDAGAVEVNLTGGDTRAMRISSSVANSFGLDITQNNTGVAMRGQSMLASNSFPAIQAETNSTNSTNSAILAQNTGGGYAVSGQIPSTAFGFAAVYGNNLRSTGGVGVNGIGYNGVSGSSSYNQGFAVFGQNSGSPNITNSYFSTGVAGIGGIGVQGQTQNGQLRGVFGQNLNTGFTYNNIAVQGSSTNGVGVWGENLSNDFFGVYSNGDLGATGTKSFMIDYPVDPENKFLKHFSVESDEVLNIYRGTVSFDASGEAVVILPEYVELININFTYQLTTINGFAPVFIKEKVKNGQFIIAGGNPEIEVSYQLIGERNDLYIQKNPKSKQIIVEKRDGEKGKYLIPELYNKPIEYRMGYLGIEKMQIKN